MTERRTDLDALRGFALALGIAVHASLLHLWFLWFLCWFVAAFGLLPMPHLLLFYGCFYFFGAATFAAEGMQTRLGARWPLLLAAQLANREWPLPGEVKFLLILVAVTAVLLVSYAWCVRPTIIGRILNGPRPAAKR